MTTNQATHDDLERPSQGRAYVRTVVDGLVVEGWKNIAAELKVEDERTAKKICEVNKLPVVRLAGTNRVSMSLLVIKEFMNSIYNSGC